MTGHPDQWFGGVTYAQHGDDLAVLNLFKRIGVERGTYLDVGAHHPFDLSNTALLHERGWRGVNVEANPDLIPAFLDARPEDVNVLAAVLGDVPHAGTVQLHRISERSGINSTMLENLSGHHIKDAVDVPAVTLPQIVQEHCGGRWPDFLTLDAEGRDLEILRSVPRPQFSVICTEAVSQMGDVSSQLRDWALENGYFIHSWLGGNVMMVLDTLRDMIY